MPDITMCEGKECPLKETCYRYRAIPSENRQPYFDEPPYQGEKCEYWMEIYKDPSKTITKGNTMKTLASLALMATATLSADWHSWDTPPQEGELCMMLYYEGDAAIPYRRLYIIQHYNDYTLRLSDGWFDVDKNDLWIWIHQQATLMYFPDSPTDDYYNLSSN